MRVTATCRNFIVLSTCFYLALTVAAQSSASLTNTDIEKMLKAQVPEAVILRTIQVSQPNFVLTPDALVSLKHHHVPDSILGAMMDSQSGMQMQHVQPPMMYPPVHSSGSHIHQLPNIDAAIRLDDKSIGKVQVRKNEIKVEKAGVPLLSVKWKVNGDK